MESASKLLSLREMIARYVMPGTLLHLAGGIGGPSAATCEIIRQFHGSNPGFGLIQSTITGHSINLFHEKLVNQAIFAACADISNSGRPSRIMQQAWAEKQVTLENWSLGSLQQRLMAGALGLPFLPTRSVDGSSLADYNKKDFHIINNPFTGGSSGVISSLNPDVSIIHGCIADEYGNTVTPVPYGEDVWGPLAAKTVLITVEKIVPTDVIRRYAALVKIPGASIAAVAEVPLGLHPFSLAAPGIAEVEEYETDIPFLVGLHKAFATDESLNAWLQEWILGCQDHGEFLKKLGAERILSLRYTQKEKSVERTPEPAVTDTPATAEEIVLITAAREIERCIRSSGYRTILAGAGNRASAVLVAWHRLRESGYHLDIITGNGQLGYEPGPGALGTQGNASVRGSVMLTDTVTSLGTIVGGAQNRCLSVLGAGQVDRYGNINSTLTASGQFLVGSGGANDAGNASEVLIIINQSPDRFPEQLPYITCPGKQVTTVVTTQGVFRKEKGSTELLLAGCLPDESLPELESRIERIRENCGWPFNTAESVINVAPPSEEELRLLRRLTAGRA